MGIKGKLSDGADLSLFELSQILRQLVSVGLLVPTHRR